MRFLTLFFISFFVAGTCIAQNKPNPDIPSSDIPNPDIMVVFDASGSMWGQIEGVSKIEIARKAFQGLSADWSTKGVSAGLMAYGHRRKGDCSDIELISRPSIEASAAMATQVQKLKPKGKTPLSAAVRQAADVLKFQENAATVVLLSDGIETCNLNPCEVGKELEDLGIDFTAHVIGFDIQTETDKTQLKCLAENTGGKYFDANNANELNDALKEVAAAPTRAPETPASDIQSVTIRVRMESSLMSLPDEIVIYSGNQEIGSLSEADAVVPGLVVDLPVGTVALKVEGENVFGQFTMDITNETEFLDLNLSPMQDDYVLWRNRALPVMDDHIVLIKNTTGVDRSTFHRVYLYPLGSTDESQRIKGSNIGPSAGIFHAITIPSPPAPGDYEIVPTGTDGTEYARIPMSFASEITPVWLGARTVKPGGVMDAYWAGSTNRRDGFQFRKDGTRVSRISVSAMAQDDGFKLVAPEESGLYELVFISEYKNNFEFKETSFGQIAVGVPLPEDDSVLPITADPDVDGLAEETDAMGGEEFPLIPVGDLHGDWQLIFQNDIRTLPLIKSQIVHEKGDEIGGGGLVVEAHPDWGFGPTGTFGEMILAHDEGDTLLMTLTVEGGTLVTTLTQSDSGWTGALQTISGETHNVVLVKFENLNAAEAARNSEPINHQFRPVDERDMAIETLVDWTVQSDAMDTPDKLQSQSSRTDIIPHPPGDYQITATSGNLYGKTSITLGRGYPRSNTVILKPKSEGADLALDVTFYCSPDEDCDMEMRSVPIYFTLPVGWGAERPFQQLSGHAQFNMTTNTNDGPFFATLNLPQRMADLGPCVQLVTGTFCHDATDDSKLLTDIGIIKRSLSFQPVGQTLNAEKAETLIRKLTGTAQ